MHSPIELNKISVKINSKTSRKQVTSFPKDHPNLPLENITPKDAHHLEQKLISLDTFQQDYFNDLGHRHQVSDQ